MNAPHDRNSLLRRRPSQRGSVLITALIFAIVIAISLATYINLATNSLRMASRSFFADAANNLAETGIEEAVWSFNKMGNSTSSAVISSAWSGWTLGNTVAGATMISMGSGYTSAPTVTFSGGGGSGATGTGAITTVYPPRGSPASITMVTGVTMSNMGTGYTSAPTVTLTGGGGSGATAVAVLSATRTFEFDNLDQNATGVVKVWVDGYDGSSVTPIVVSRATITPYSGPAIEKTLKVILGKNGVLPKGVVAKHDINWNGHPFADSFQSSPNPGVPPFQLYDSSIARSNTTVGSIQGPTIDLSHGTVNGNVEAGPGVIVTGGTITGQEIGNVSNNIVMPTYPSNSGGAGQYDLGGSLPANLPRAGDAAASDGSYYYFVHNATIGAVSIDADSDVVIVGDDSTQMTAGLMVQVSGTHVGKATIYMDGPLTLSGNDQVNTTSWAGALLVYTTTTATCSISGNATFYGCFTAPNATLQGNGSGSEQSDLSGSFVVGYLSSNGHMNFHYDEGLKDLATGKVWVLGLWTELQSASDRAVYDSQLNSF